MKKLLIAILLCACQSYAADVVIGTLSQLTNWTAGVDRIAQFGVAGSPPTSTGLLCSIYMRAKGGDGGAAPSGGGGGAGGLVITNLDLGPGAYSIALWSNATAFGSTAYVGGKGGAGGQPGLPGGSGGGGGGSDIEGDDALGGAATNGQGNAGADYTRVYWYAGSGGGGKSAAGIPASATNYNDTIVRAGRGGGGYTNPVTGAVYCRGGYGNGFAGHTWDGGAGLDPTNQTAGLGNGGTGENDSGTGGLGSSSGLTIMYEAESQQATGGAITTNGTWIIHEYTGFETNVFTIGG